MDDSGMEKNAVIRNYSPSDKEAVIDLIGRVWDSKVRESYELFWDWLRARDSTSVDGKDIGLVIDIDGKIYGYSGKIPVRFKAGNCQLDGNFSIATSTDQSIRGEGYGFRMMKKHLESNLCIGSATPRATRLWTRLCGRKDIVVKQSIKMVKILDPSPFLHARGVPSVLASVVAAVWKFNSTCRIKMSAFGRKDRENGRTMEKIREYPEAIDAFLFEFSKDFQFMIHRDRDFLNWRFVSCPLKYENWLLRENGEVAGYMVYRFTMMNRRKILILLETMALGDKKKNYRFMLDHLLEAGIRGRVSDIQTLENGCPVLAAELKRRGFLERKDGSPIIGMLNQDAARVHDIWGSEKWFLGAGDADFEFIFFNQGLAREEGGNN